VEEAVVASLPVEDIVEEAIVVEVEAMLPTRTLLLADDGYCRYQRVSSHSQLQSCFIFPDDVSESRMYDII
jgi:hypothetical protein